MKPALRHIAVTVVERREGKFGWQLLEQDQEGNWNMLEKADNVSSRYAHAMSAGLERLQALVEDLAAGPRHLAERSRKPESGEVARPSSPDASATRRGTLFGFGPLK